MSRAKRERRQQKRDVRAFLERVIVRLRVIFRSRSVPYYRENPEARRPCHTCAFNPGTDGARGFDATVIGLQYALLGDHTFYCHDNLPKGPDGDWLFDPRIAVPCAAWALVKDGPEAKRECVRGMLEDGDRVSDAVCDRMMPFIAETAPASPKRKVVDDVAHLMAPGVTPEMLIQTVRQAQKC